MRSYPVIVCAVLACCGDSPTPRMDGGLVDSGGSGATDSMLVAPDARPARGPLTGALSTELCVTARSCGIRSSLVLGRVPLFPDDLGNCVFGLQVEHDIGPDLDRPLIADAFECIERAGADCNAARACLAIEERRVSSCEDRCDGDVLVRCHGDVESSVDCTVGARRCIEALAGPDCGSAACTPVSELSGTCDGTDHVYCDNGVEMRGECFSGQTCIEGFRGSVCGGTGTECTTNACDGDLQQRCSFGSRFSTPFDCSRVGVTCVVDDIQGAQCLSAARECDDFRDEDSCTPEGLRFCVRGAWQTYDCEGRGWGACTNSGGRAHCDAPLDDDLL